MTDQRVLTTLHGDAPHEAARARATALFGAMAIAASVTVGAMLVSGWRGGSLDNRIEWLFWAGAILAGTGIGCEGLGAIVRRPRALPATGMVLFLVGPVLCIVAVFADYWI